MTCARLRLLCVATALVAGCARRPAPPPPPSDPAMALDSLVERPEAWEPATDRFRPTVQGATSHGTRQALCFEAPTTLGPFKDDVFQNPQVPRRFLRLPDQLDLSRFTRLTVWAKETGRRGTFIHVGLSSQRRVWGKGVVRTMACAPIDRGPWRQYTVNFHHLHPAARRRLRYLLVMSTCVGHQPDEEPVTRVYLDDWRLSNPPQRKHTGWGADPAVVTVSQCGFKRFAEKLALVPGDCPEAEFTVHRAGSRRVVLGGRLETVGGPLGRYKVARFDRLTRPGRYEVRVGALRSLPFRVADDAFGEPLHFIYRWLRDMRCGCATRRHMACHLDDALWEGKHVDVSGGWHDAGDVRTYWFHSAQVPFTALRLYRLGHRHDDDGDGRDDFVADALWGARHLVKVHDALGWFPQKIRDWPDYRRGNYWTDNRVGTPDDRRIIERPMHLDTEGDVMALAGILPQHCPPERRKLADRLLAVAGKRFEHFWQPKAGKDGWRANAVKDWHGYHVAHWLRGMLWLYKATGDRRYLVPLEHYAEALLGYQKREWPESATRPLCGEIFSWMRGCRDRDLPEEALALLCDAFPDHPRWHQWHFALVRGVEHWHKPVRALWRPFGVSQLEQSERDVRRGGHRRPFQVRGEGTVLVRDHAGHAYLAIRTLGKGATALLGWDLASGTHYVRDILVASAAHARRLRGTKPHAPVRTLLWTPHLDVPAPKALEPSIARDGGRRGIAWSWSLGIYHNVWRSLRREGDGKAFPMAHTAAREPAALARQLEAADVLVVPSQEKAPAGALTAAGKALAATLQQFVRGGGLVVAMASPPQAGSLVAAAGLLDHAPVEPQKNSRSSYHVAAEHPVTATLPPVHAVQRSVGVQITDAGPASRYVVPFGGPTQLPGTAASLMKVARTLNDPELERLVTWQVQWALGHNPWNLSFVIDYGPDCVTQAYSFSQGRLPGSVTVTFGLGDRGMPRHVRPAASEVCVGPGRRLVEALGEIAAPATLRLRLLDGGRPHRGRAEVWWPRGKQRATSARTDRNGRLPDIRLPGGTTYELRVPHAKGLFRLPLPVVSGTRYERTIDLAGHLVLRGADAPADVAPNAPFRIALTVANPGHGEATARVRAVAADCRLTSPPEQAVVVPGGGSRVVTWELESGAARRPYIVRFELDGDHARDLDVTGTIAAPATTARGSPTSAWPSGSTPGEASR